MEQMYLLEIFIDKVAIFVDDAEENGPRERLTMKIKFGPKIQFIVKEGQLAVNKNVKDDIVECNRLGKRQWSRTIRVGKSYLFPSYPDTVLMILSKFPLEIEVWNDDDSEKEIFVGIGTMHWETEFFHMLKDTADICKMHEPLSIKQHTPLFAECCCRQVGEIAFILRLSALGESIITEFQQLMADPDKFVFRTNKAPSMFQCQLIEGDNPNFCMVGSLYETATLEDPNNANEAKNGEQKIEICTELQSCGTDQKHDKQCARSDSKENPEKKYAVDKIRMGDIVGPCGNTNCALAHKVRTYIRNLESYKSQAQGITGEKKGKSTDKVCGSCCCKDDRWHRDTCPDVNTDQAKVSCGGCASLAPKGQTCENKRDKFYAVNQFMLNVPQSDSDPKKSPYDNSDLKRSLFGTNFLVDNCQLHFEFQKEEVDQNNAISNQSGGCCNKKMDTSIKNIYSNPNSNSSQYAYNNTNDQVVYNVESNVKKNCYPTKHNNNNIIVCNVAQCLEIPDDKNCKCSPTKPTPPCKTFDCECITEKKNEDARKNHKPYCPAYKHKKNCPATASLEDENKNEEDEDEAESLPYGLPPIHLGPCPVIGRPCTVPDGFARMYKNAALPPAPPSYSDAGKVCCSKEFERIKKALKDYMKYEKDHDYRCINKFNVDTETRCCDKEQTLFSLMGKNCCGEHKISIQEKYKNR